jgi:hypothetical protein
MRSYGRLHAVGVEGTGSYGAALARHLAAEQVKVIEVNRPDRRQRRAKGKSDPLDAYAAADAVLSGRAIAVPKAGDGIVESIRALHPVRSGAIKSRTQLDDPGRGGRIESPGQRHAVGDADDAHQRVREGTVVDVGVAVGQRHVGVGEHSAVPVPAENGAEADHAMAEVLACPQRAEAGRAIDGDPILVQGKDLLVPHRRGVLIHAVDDQHGVAARRPQAVQVTVRDRRMRAHPVEFEDR